MDYGWLGSVLVNTLICTHSYQSCTILCACTLQPMLCCVHTHHAGSRSGRFGRGDSPLATERQVGAHGQGPRHRRQPGREGARFSPAVAGPPVVVRMRMRMRRRRRSVVVPHRTRQIQPRRELGALGESACCRSTRATLKIGLQGGKSVNVEHENIVCFEWITAPQ